MDTKSGRFSARGRFALAKRRARGLGGKPETFQFLGLTHLCGRSRTGGFLLRRQTERTRMAAKLRQVKTELQRRRHQPIPEQGRPFGRSSLEAMPNMA